MSRKDLLDFLNERGFEDTILLEGEDFDESIVGFTDEGHLIYSYDSMVENLAKAYTKEGEDEDKAYNEALEFIDYNTIRAIPYMKNQGKEPIIQYSFDI